MFSVCTRSFGDVLMDEGKLDDALKAAKDPVREEIRSQ
jgi:hypothetical protein